MHLGACAQVCPLCTPSVNPSTCYATLGVHVVHTRSCNAHTQAHAMHTPRHTTRRARASTRTCVWPCACGACACPCVRRQLWTACAPVRECAHHAHRHAPPHTCPCTQACALGIPCAFEALLTRCALRNPASHAELVVTIPWFNLQLRRDLIELLPFQRGYKKFSLNRQKEEIHEKPQAEI